MNAEEIALEFEQYLKEIEEQPWGNHEIYLSEAIQMLRRLQKERDLLFSAHSHEMVRADELQIECARLYRIVELNGKMADELQIECARLYRIIELNEKRADRVYDFDNPLLDVCKHGNDSACKECYLETVKK